MNPQEFFKQHPSLKGKQRKDSYDATDEWGVKYLESTPEYFMKQDILATQTDNALLLQFIEEKEKSAKETMESISVLGARSLDVAHAWLQFGREMRDKFFFGKDVPRVECGCGENSVCENWRKHIDVDDLKRALKKVRSSGTWKFNGESYDDVFEKKILEELGLEGGDT